MSSYDVDDKVAATLRQIIKTDYGILVLRYDVVQPALVFEEIVYPSRDLVLSLVGSKGFFLSWLEPRLIYFSADPQFNSRPRFPPLLRPPSREAPTNPTTAWW